MMHHLFVTFALCATLCFFFSEDALAMKPNIPAVEAGYDAKTCVYSDSPYILSIDWISMSAENRLMDRLFPDNIYSTSDYVKSYLSDDVIFELQENSVYHEDYCVIPDSHAFNHNLIPTSKMVTIKDAKISGTLIIPAGARDTVVFDIDAIGPKFDNVSFSMFASGVMTLRINQPVLLCGHHIKKGKCSFLLIELKTENGGYCFGT